MQTFPFENIVKNSFKFYLIIKKKNNLESKNKTLVLEIIKDID